jgi:hypothetical protein
MWSHKIPWQRRRYICRRLEDRIVTLIDLPSTKLGVSVRLAFESCQYLNSDLTLDALHVCVAC